MSKDLYASLKERRTFYSISKESTVSDERIEALIKDAVTHTPSAFNSQSARVVVLFNENHNCLWNMTKEALRKIVPAEGFASTEEKINSFAKGYGTVLFFEDNSVIESLQASFPLYKDNFPIWSMQSSGMLQYVIWSALEVEGLGASLQHYNPIIDAEVAKQWQIPNTWKLIAQMPFGKPTASPGEKQFNPIEERVKIYR